MAARDPEVRKLIASMGGYARSARVGDRALRTARATEVTLDLGAERRAHDPVKLDRAKRTLRAAVKSRVITLDDLIRDLVDDWPPADEALKADLAALLRKDQ